MDEKCRECVNLKHCRKWMKKDERILCAGTMKVTEEDLKEEAPEDCFSMMA